MQSFEISEYLQDRNGNRGKCKDCSMMVIWARSRVAAHKRSTCPAASDEEKRKFSKRPASSLSDSNNNSSFEADTSAVEACSCCRLTQERKSEIDSKLANFFFRTGISLRLVESHAFKDLVNSLNPAYAASMPCAKTLSGSLLDQQFEKCSSRLEEIMSTSENLTLVSDGWTNVRGDHIVNFCIKAPNQKPFFYDSVNTSGVRQNSQAVASEIVNVIEQLGSEKFSSVITDNAPVMKAAWKIIEAKFPTISAVGCAAHATNLLVKDIVDTPEHSKTIKSAEKIIKYVTNHHLVKSKYEEKRAAAQVSHTLSMSVQTRWFSLYKSMNDLLASKYVLIQLVDEENDMLKEITPKNTSVAVLNLIKLNDFWTNLTQLVKAIEYPSNIIGKLEADDAQLGLVYHYFGQLYKHFANDRINQEKVTSRLKFSYSPQMGLAYIFTPRYAAEGFYFDDQYTDIIASAQEIAKNIDHDSEESVANEMISFVTEMSEIPESRQQTLFRMTAKQYWSVIGKKKFPALFKIAKPITEMICSSAIAERSWSTFRFIHSRLRNRLTNDRVKKLVFIYTNCVLLDSVDTNDYILEDGAVVSGNDCELQPLFN